MKIKEEEIHHLSQRQFHGEISIEKFQDEDEDFSHRPQLVPHYWSYLGHFLIFEE